MKNEIKSEAKQMTNGIEVKTYQLFASNGKPVRKATMVRWADGYEVKFMERMPIRMAVSQAVGVRARQAGLVYSNLEAKQKQFA